MACSFCHCQPTTDNRMPELKATCYTCFRMLLLMQDYGEETEGLAILQEHLKSVSALATAQ